MTVLSRAPGGTPMANLCLQELLQQYASLAEALTTAADTYQKLLAANASENDNECQESLNKWYRQEWRCLASRCLSWLAEVRSFIQQLDSGIYRTHRELMARLTESLTEIRSQGYWQANTSSALASALEPIASRLTELNNQLPKTRELCQGCCRESVLLFPWPVRIRWRPRYRGISSADLYS